MNAVKDPFEVVAVEESADDFAIMSRKSVALGQRTEVVPSVATARFDGFDLRDHPLISGLADLPGEVTAARTTIPLLGRQVGSTVVVVFEQGDVRRPIVIGVLLEPRIEPATVVDAPQLVSVQTDNDRLVFSAEREIVLRCGDASITLTRAGKVLIKGNYVLSHSAGNNKIKGAAVDIN